MENHVYKIEEKFDKWSPIQRSFKSRDELLNHVNLFMTDELVEIYGSTLIPIKESIENIFQGQLSSEEKIIKINHLKDRMNYITEKLRGERGTDDYISAVHTVIEGKI